MGDKISLKLDERTVHGKKVRALRRDGVVPGVVYGPGMEPVAVQVASNILEKVYVDAGKHTPVHLSIGAKKRIALIKDIDNDTLRRTIKHVSFHAVKANEPVTAEIPVVLMGEGESEAEKAGLIVLQVLDKLEVKALPMDLPDKLEADITGLKEAGDRITVGDIKVPENVEIVDNDDGREGTDDDDQTIMDQVVANVYEPSALQAANEAAGGDAEDESAVAAENGSDSTQAEDNAKSANDDRAHDAPKSDK